MQQETNIVALQSEGQTPVAGGGEAPAHGGCRGLPGLKPGGDFPSHGGLNP